VAPQPVFPNRMLLLPLVLVASVLAGGAAAFALSQARPVFFDPRELRAKLDIPVLGIVTAVVGDAHKRRQRMDRLRFVFASGGLVAVFAAGLTTMSLIAQR
jgi:hypothetical protein